MAKVKINIPPIGVAFQVPRFAEHYETFLNANPSARPRLKIFALLLVVMSAFALVNGLLAGGLGYRYMTVKLIDGTFDVHYIRVHLVFIFLIGGSVLLIGMAMFKDGAGVSAEQFLAEEYELIGEEGELSDRASCLHYLGEGQFLVKR